LLLASGQFPWLALELITVQLNQLNQVSEFIGIKCAVPASRDQNGILLCVKPG
jgi:hypothetical protein